MRYSWHFNTAPHETSMGFKFIGNSLMESGQFEQLESEWVRRIIKDADVFVNVGANVGYYCCIALQERGCSNADCCLLNQYMRIRCIFTKI